MPQDWNVIKISADKKICPQIFNENMVLLLLINVIKLYVNVPIHVKFILEAKISTIQHENDKRIFLLIYLKTLN